MNRRWAVFLGTAGLVLGAVAVRAQISGNVPPNGQSVPEQIPYRGYLENDGAPYNGLAWLRFQIFTASTGGNPLWTEEHGDTTGVPVANGSFGVALGSITAFTAANVTTIDNRSLFQYPELYIGVSVKLGSASANYVDLGQRQRILSSPYSMVSRQAENFSVSGQLSVLGTAGITGMLTLSNGLTVSSGGVTVANGGLTVSNGNASISGNASVGGTLTSAGAFTASNGATLNGASTISNISSATLNGTLTLGANGHFAGVEYVDVQVPPNSSNFTFLSNANNTICGLATIATNNGSGTPSCSIWKSGASWVGSASANTNCWAACFVF